MHPFFGRPVRLAWYLVAWLVVGALIAAVLTRLGLGWFEALALILPLFLVYSFVCLSAWYVCRAAPLRPDGVGRVVASCVLAAVVAGALWLGFVRLWVGILGGTGTSFASDSDRYEQLLPFLFAVGVLSYLLAIAVHYALIAVETAGEAERQRLQADILTRDAELRALRAQVNPHFLYNSLNSISALTSIDPARAREMCVLLADFLRMTLGMGEKALIPLREELVLLEKYCAIEKVRFGERLTVQEEIQEETKECAVPPLLLQPLVENAVVHGIAQLPEGGWIRLKTTRSAGRIGVTVENSWDPEAGPSRKNGVGLKNVQRRLEARYGTEARLEAKAEEEVFRVSLSFPAEAEGKA
jgi:hypothetical protein